MVYFINTLRYFNLATWKPGTETVNKSGMYYWPDFSLLFNVSFYDLFAFFSFFMTSAVVRGFAALFSLRYCERLSSDIFFALLGLILVDVVDLSAVTLIPCGQSTFRLSALMISISHGKLLSFQSRRLLFRKGSFNDLSPIIP